MTYTLDGNQYSRQFVQTDAGRAKSLRVRQRNDCAVRALAIAAALEYDKAYNALARCGRRSGRGTSELILTDALSESGITYRRHTFPAIKGQRRINPVSFPVLKPQGRFMVRVAKHYYAYLDGVAYDEAPSNADRCIYSAIEVIL